MIFISPPSVAVVILCDGVLYIKADNCILQIRRFFFISEFGKMVADDNESLIFVFIMPFPQRGNHVLAINSAKCPHVNDHDFAAQACKP